MSRNRSFFDNLIVYQNKTNLTHPNEQCIQIIANPIFINSALFNNFHLQSLYSSCFPSERLPNHTRVIVPNVHHYLLNLTSFTTKIPNWKVGNHPPFPPFYYTYILACNTSLTSPTLHNFPKSLLKSNHDQLVTGRS